MHAHSSSDELLHHLYPCLLHVYKKATVVTVVCFLTVALALYMLTLAYTFACM